MEISRPGTISCFPVPIIEVSRKEYVPATSQLDLYDRPVPCDRFDRLQLLHPSPLRIAYSDRVLPRCEHLRLKLASGDPQRVNDLAVRLADHLHHRIVQPVHVQRRQLATALRP